MAYVTRDRGGIGGTIGETKSQDGIVWQITSKII